MCEVTATNFEDECEEIQRKIRGCSFVAFDTEFTALTIDSDNETTSLFDCGSDRYDKYYSNATKGIASQIGLAIFKSVQNVGNEYGGGSTFVCDSYNFYVCPKSLASYDPRFVCQASSIQFLAKHNFDFNKFLRDGIPYLNGEQESELLRDLGDGTLLRGIERRNVTFADEDKLADATSKVTQWIKAKGQPRHHGNEMIVDIGTHDPTAKYLLHQQIRSSHQNLWTFDSKKNANEVLIKVVTEEERKDFVDNDSSHLDLIDKHLGFAKVFRTLVDSKKPLVGHNCLMDLMKMCYQFGNDPLPKTYRGFKAQMTSMFPAVYDTKLVCFELKRTLEDIQSKFADRFQSTNLETLKSFLESKAGEDFSHLPFAPQILHGCKSLRYEENVIAHEAGYDAFMTGFAFLKAAHYAATINYLTPQSMRPLSFKEYLHCLRTYKNKLNIARASIVFINLDGDDMKAKRPAQIYVSLKNGGGGDGGANNRISRRQFQTLIAHKLSSYGSVDVKLLSKSGGHRDAIVAVSNHRAARDILLAFENDEDLLVTNYSEHKRQQLLKYSLGISSSVILISMVTVLVAKHLNA